MQFESRAGQIFVAWNGMHLSCPEEWDVRVGGHRNLIFEEDFQPQMQLRWDKASGKSIFSHKNGLSVFKDTLGAVMTEPPAPWRRLQQTFSHVAIYQDEHGAVGGGACLCPHCSTVLFFQLLNNDPAVNSSAADCFASLCCHPDQKNLWRVQDFSLMTPPSFKLTSYTFGAGLTRLSFRHKDLVLHTCRIAAADARLSSQTLEQILLTIADAQ